MINTKIHEVRKDIVSILNQSGLPISVINLVIKDLTYELIELERQTLEKEAQNNQNEVEE